MRTNRGTSVTQAVQRQIQRLHAGGHVRANFKRGTSTKVPNRHNPKSRRRASTRTNRMRNGTRHHARMAELKGCRTLEELRASLTGHKKPTNIQKRMLEIMQVRDWVLKKCEHAVVCPGNAYGKIDMLLAHRVHKTPILVELKTTNKKRAVAERQLRNKGLFSTQLLSAKLQVGLYKRGYQHQLRQSGVSTRGIEAVQAYVAYAFKDDLVLYPIP